MSTKILIIDDDADIRLIAGLFLRNTGNYEIHEAETAAEGLEQVRHQRPDLVILDFMLPDAQGDDLITTLLETHPCKIIVLTARVDAELSQRFTRLGAECVLHKPFNPEEFAVQVQKVLNG